MENFEEQIIESPVTEVTEAAPEAEAREETSPEAPAGEAESAADPVPALEERVAALEEALARQTEQYMQREQDLALRRHFSSLEKQAEELRQSFPDFELAKELEDPVFVKLTSPQVGVPVEIAYYVTHHRQLAEASAQAAAQMLGNSVQAGRNMPTENGTVARESPPGGFIPLAKLSPEERKLRMDMIRRGDIRFD